jgi:hypothetical protein
MPDVKYISVLQLLCNAFITSADMSSIADETESVNASCSGIEHPAAWRKCAPAFCSLKDIMSETLANELHQKEVNSPLR